MDEQRNHEVLLYEEPIGKGISWRGLQKQNDLMFFKTNNKMALFKQKLLSY